MSPATEAPRWAQAISRARAEEPLTHEDLVTLLQSGPEATLELYQVADAVRSKYVGDEIHLRGLIEFSNICRKNCDYCGLRRGNEALPRFRMSLEEIRDTAETAARMGFRSLVLQSGEDAWFTIDRLVELIKAIKARCDVAITLSCGEWSREDYARMFEAGADRYLIKHETADEGLFKALHPDDDFQVRQQCLRDLDELGFQVGSGCMVGLPGQSLDMLAKDLELFRDLDVDMAGIGPFIPNPLTPLGHAARGTVELTLKMVALARIVTKNAHLPATTALTTLDPMGREKAWQAGANVAMPQVTPLEHRAKYQIYPDKACLFDETSHCWSCLHGRIARLGRRVSTDYGHSFKPRYQEVSHG